MGEAMDHAANQIASRGPDRGPQDLRFRYRLGLVERELTQKAFEIHGLGEASMNQVWEWICILTADGKNLKEICCVPGAPSIRTVFAWRRKYPVFDQAFRDAEDIRAYLLAEEATDRGRDATDKTAQAAKVAFQALTWRAAKLDPGRFADKKIEEHRLDFSQTATEELRSRIASFLAAHPHLAEHAKGIIEMKATQANPAVIDVTPSSEDPPPG